MGTTATLPPPAPSATEPEFRPYRLTIDQYERMIAAGIFDANAPVFLWQGRLVEKMPKGRPHCNALAKIASLMAGLLPAGWHVEQENPIAIGNDAMPEPDVTVVRGGRDDYPAHAPRAQDVGLVVEVSDSSLAADSGPVLESYARAAIPVYWIVNVPRRRIEVYSGPTGSAYATVQLYGPDEAVPVVLDGVAVGRVAVRDVLP